MDTLRKAFENQLSVKFGISLDTSGTVQKDELTIKYILTKDASEKLVLDFLIFRKDGFRPDHKRINARGEILDLENFQFSIMYEFPEERKPEELKRKNHNQRTANLIINKGLADPTDEWIQKYS